MSRGRASASGGAGRCVWQAWLSLARNFVRYLSVAKTQANTDKQYLKREAAESDLSMKYQLGS